MMAQNRFNVYMKCSIAELFVCGQMEVELSRFQKENNILELKVVEEHKKLKAKEEEMIMERTRVSIYRFIVHIDQ